jgi:hypothetical protein
MRDTTAIPALTSLLTSEPISDMVLLRENHLSLQPLALLVIESLYLPVSRMPTGKMHMPLFHLSGVFKGLESTSLKLTEDEFSVCQRTTVNQMVLLYLDQQV